MSNSLTRNNPFNFFDPFFDDFFTNDRNPHHKNIMKTDISDEGEHYQLKIDVPEVKKEDIKISLNDGYLTINVVHQNENSSDKNSKYIRRERFYGSYSRSYYLGEYVSEDDVKAKLENGVLTLNVLKQKEEPKNKDKYIAIE